MPKVNPEILTWARETAGLTPEEAARKLGFRDAQKWTAAGRLTAYESGHYHPSRSVLVRMSKQYHRPLLTFYLSNPPRKGDHGADFRTLPADRSDKDEAILDALIRGVQARQSMVRAAMEDEDEADGLPFIGSRKMSDGRQAAVKSLRSLLGVNRKDYYAQPHAAAAFNLLRDAAEDAGVFVLLKGNLGTHHTQIGTEVFRGGSIADEVAPFVVINEDDAKSAWSFTLLHELVHLILGQTGISSASAENDIERFCDDIAARFLLRNSEIKELRLEYTKSIDDLADHISEFANGRNLSRTMVAYRAYRIGEIDQPTYGHLSNLFRRQWLENRTRRREHQRQAGGGDYYVTRRHRVGNGLINLVQRMMAAGALSTTKASTVLGVKPHQVQSLVGLG
jgi:Zn-dependent peptidase ImmA (M78 family)/transcriptional regulator with XRE-family HTH domain